METIRLYLSGSIEGNDNYVAPGAEGGFGLFYGARIFSENGVGGSRRYLELKDHQLLRGSVLKEVDPLVEEASVHMELETVPQRERGVYKHGDAEAEVDLGSGIKSSKYLVFIRGGKMRDVLQLLRLIKTGAVRPDPEESYEREQAGQSRKELLALVESLQLESEARRTELEKTKGLLEGALKQIRVLGSEKEQLESEKAGVEASNVTLRTEADALRASLEEVGGAFDKVQSKIPILEYEKGRLERENSSLRDAKIAGATGVQEEKQRLQDRIDDLGRLVERMEKMRWGFWSRIPKILARMKMFTNPSAGGGGGVRKSRRTAVRRGSA